MLAKFNLTPPPENHPQMECLNLLNKKLDTIIQMMALQSEGFHSLPFKFVSLSGNGMQFYPGTPFPWVISWNLR